jgi:hypothetical protein
MEEVNLWVAVLQQAAADASGRDLDQPWRRREALDWFFSGAETVGSFRWIAHSFNLNPARLREKLLIRSQASGFKISTALHRSPASPPPLKLTLNDKPHTVGMAQL